MKNISEQVWRKGISLLLVLCMICTLFGQYLPCIVAKAADTTTYTVELNGTSDLLLSNATASNGPITLTYTVESATTGTTNNGVVATKSATGDYPYGSGDMRFHHAKNRMLEQGKTYTIQLSVGDDGRVVFECSWTKADGTPGTGIGFERHTNTDATGSQYFGIYVASSTTAKLTNVTCVDAEGNDLGLQVNTKNSDKCTITMDVQEEETTSYMVELNGTSDMLLSNATASNGPVTLTYTVESASTGTTNNGVVATKSATGDYPYGSGDMRYHHAKNRMLEQGKTYTIQLSVGDDGRVVFECSWTKADGTPGTGIGFERHTNTDATGSQYFGIYVASSTTAKLTNVTCVDAEGNDLGLQVNTKNSEKCTITDDSQEGNTPGGGEPGGDEPIELVPADDSNAEKHTLNIDAESNFFFGNKEATSGIVTLRYTVESSTTGDSNNGVVATTNPTGEYPYTSGDMYYHNTKNRMMIEGCTYTIVLGVDESGYVAYEGSWTNEAENTSGSISLPTHTSGNAATAQYFGIYVSSSTTATLTNVTCVDSEGNDLGISTNRKEALPVPDDSNAVKYTVKTGKVSSLFIGNKLASDKAVTLRYTVESAVADTVNNNGIVATTKPTSTYPYTAGSMKYYHMENVVMVEGRTYTLTMALDNNGKVNYEGYYTDAENTSPVFLEGMLPNSAGEGATDSQYYGIYVAPATEVKLINVTCVNADGNDLGIQTNVANCLITAGDDGEQKAEETLGSDYAAITLGNFGVEDGTYTKVMRKGSYALSMHKKVFSVDIEFSKDVGEDFRYGGQGDGWHGLRFWSDKTCLYMEDVDGRSERYTFIPLIAGITLVGEEFNLKISTEYVDCDEDGQKDDVKLGVWFNNKLYNNEYIYLKDYKKMLGKNLGVYSSNEIAYITVKSVAGIETGIDYTIFGFTRNWMQELGIK